MSTYVLCLVLLSSAGFSQGAHLTDHKWGKIVGGTAASKNEFPFLVPLLREDPWTKGKRIQFCGGSIISDKWILTAAHCFYPIRNQTVEIRVGEHSLAEADGEVVHFAKNIINHPQFYAPSLHNDVALIELSSPITFVTDKVGVIKINEALEANDGTMTVAGWGRTDSGKESDIPRKVDVDTVPISICAAAYAGVNIYNSSICAAAPWKDSCKQDSGGPLFTSFNDDLVQTGIVSGGRGCATDGYPGVYARVSSFADWIKQTAGI